MSRNNLNKSARVDLEKIANDIAEIRTWVTNVKITLNTLVWKLGRNIHDMNRERAQEDSVDDFEDEEEDE